MRSRLRYSNRKYNRLAIGTLLARFFGTRPLLMWKLVSFPCRSTKAANKPLSGMLSETTAVVKTRPMALHSLHGPFTYWQVSSQHFRLDNDAEPSIVRLYGGPQGWGYMSNRRLFVNFLSKHTYRLFQFHSWKIQTHFPYRMTWNWPFPSSCPPPLQSESMCVMVICSTLHYEWKLIFIRETSYSDSVWRGGRHKLGNGLFSRNDFQSPEVIFLHNFLRLGLWQGSSRPSLPSISFTPQPRFEIHHGDHSFQIFKL